MEGQNPGSGMEWADRVRQQGLLWRLRMAMEQQKHLAKPLRTYQGPPCLPEGLVHHVQYSGDLGWTGDTVLEPDSPGIPT